jgi:hypothetical protein
MYKCTKSKYMSVFIGSGTFPDGTHTGRNIWRSQKTTTQPVAHVQLVGLNTEKWSSMFC